VGLGWYRADAIGKFVPGLGPPRPNRHEDTCDSILILTVDRDSFRRDRSPNRVAKRFPDWTAVGFRSRFSLASLSTGEPKIAAGKSATAIRTVVRSTEAAIPCVPDPIP